MVQEQEAISRGKGELILRIPFATAPRLSIHPLSVTLVSVVEWKVQFYFGVV